MIRYLKKITMTLDKGSINKAIKELNDFEKILKPAMVHLVDRLAAKGVDVARAELVFFDASRTGALANSIKYESYDDGTAIITAGEGLETKYGSYAMFVEYGTGYEGDKNRNPQAESFGYEYDVHHHGARGWYYPAPWGTYQAEDGMMLAWTKGMAPRPFMAHTLLDLQEEARTVGGEIIAEYIKDHC